MQAVANQLRSILDPRIAFFLELNGLPIAISIAVPNMNEILKHVDGRLLPLGWLRLLYALKFHPPKTARLMLLGIRKQYHRSTSVPGLAALLLSETRRRWLAAGYNGGEISWTLEDNVRINRAVSIMGARQYKVIRLFEKTCKHHATE